MLWATVIFPYAEPYPNKTINSWLFDQNHVPTTAQEKILEAEGPSSPQDVNLTRRWWKNRGEPQWLHAPWLTAGATPFQHASYWNSIFIRAHTASPMRVVNTKKHSYANTIMLNTQSNVNRKFLHSNWTLLMKTPLLDNYGLYTSFYTLLSLRSIFPNDCQHQVIDYYTLTVLLWPLGVTIIKITDCQQVLPKHWNIFTRTTWRHNPLHCSLYIHRR